MPPAGVGANSQTTMLSLESLPYESGSARVEDSSKFSIFVGVCHLGVYVFDPERQSGLHRDDVKIWLLHTKTERTEDRQEMRSRTRNLHSLSPAIRYGKSVQEFQEYVLHSYLNQRRSYPTQSSDRYGAKCWSCHFPLNIVKNSECGKCGWLVCSCGACGCHRAMFS
jgi:hypothetical protein